MGLLERAIELVLALFIIVIFATTVFPALGEATGQDITWIIVGLVLAMVAIQ